MDAASARAIRLFDHLIQGEVPLIEAMEIVSREVGDEKLSAVILRAIDLVKKGESISKALEGVVPGPLARAVGVATDNGLLDGLLSHLASGIVDGLLVPDAPEESELTGGIYLLYVLMTTGVPLSDALDAVISIISRSELAAAFEEVHAGLKKGRMMARGWSGAGEGGSLDKTFRRIAVALRDGVIQP